MSWHRHHLALGTLALVGLVLAGQGCTEGRYLDDDDTTEAPTDDDDEIIYGGFIEGPATVDFAYVDVVGDASFQLMLRNKGLAPLRIDAVTITGIEHGIFEASHGAPAQLPPQSIDVFFPIELTFTPGDPGFVEAQLELYTTDYRYEDGEPHVIPLLGTGIIDADGDKFWSHEHYLEIDADCDDSDSAVNPAAEEVCNGIDDDCTDGPLPEEIDFDGDGFMICEGDCEDSEPTVHPGAVEICDRFDTNCDGVIPTDELDSDVDGLTECEGDCDDSDGGLNWLDLDGDGFATCEGDCDDADTQLQSADLDVDGYSTCDGDCDDLLDTVYPGALELCDGLDNDCDNSLPANEVDGDGDGSSICEGDCDDLQALLNIADADLDGYTTCDGDCNDADPTQYPGAAELCNREDDDCDGQLPLVEQDADSDGYTPCEGDCDDTSQAVFPGATETCDALDNDCDGLIPQVESDLDGDGSRICAGDCDDQDPSLNVLDEDGDGQTSCAGDCDDSDSNTFFNAPEVCDGLDNDCDGLVEIDEIDVDSDGHMACAGDCDDYEPTVYPGAPEICNDNQDNDCNGDANHCGIQGDVHLSDADAKIVGSIGDDLGDAISVGGDLTSAGSLDIALGTNSHSSEDGEVLLFTGSPLGDLDRTDADAILTADSSDGSLGYSLAFVGDVDGDGLQELLVGAPGYANSTGAAYLVHGPVSGLVNVASSSDTIVGSTEGWTLGKVVGAAGDMNGDGLADVFVGSQNDGTGDLHAGALYLVLGQTQGPYDITSAEAVLYGEQSFGFAVHSAAGGGDLNDDGTPDILIGSPGYNPPAGGAIHGFFGPVSGPIPFSQADLVIDASTSIGGLGQDVVFTPDLDGDGDIEFAFAAAYADFTSPESGVAIVVHGPSSGVLLVDDLPNQHPVDRAGHTANYVSYAGDIYDNGGHDLLVGSCFETTSWDTPGTTYLTMANLTGQQSLQNSKAVISGEAVGDEACVAVGGADLDQDGYDDVIIGAPGESSVGLNNGAVYILYGGPGW